MDLIAMRFEARHLELEGKLEEALGICRDILRHCAHEPPSEPMLQVYIQASEISVQLGDREAGSALLFEAAERHADAGLARPVIDLYRRLRRLGPGRRGLDLQFARRMLERRHPMAAREFLADLARRQKKEKLLATLDRMADWPADKVHQTLLEFLDKARNIRVSGGAPSPPVPPPPLVEQAPRPSNEVTEARPAAREPEPPTAPPTPLQAPADPSPPPEAAVLEEVTGERQGLRADAAPPRRPDSPDRAEPRDGPEQGAEEPAGEVMDADSVVFVKPETPARAAAPAPRMASRPVRPAIARPRARRSGAGRWVMTTVAFLMLAAAAAFVIPRLRSDAAAPVPAASPGAAMVEALPDSTAAAVEAEAPTEPGQSMPAAVVTPARDDTARVTPTSAPPRQTPPVPRPEPPAVPVSAAVPPPTPVQAPDTASAADAPGVSDPPAAAPNASPTGVDFPVVLVEGLEIVAITRQGEGRTQRIVVRQLLPSGDTLDLQESDLGEANVSVGVGRVLVRQHPAGGSMGSVRVGRYLVNARASVAPEALEPVLRRLVERRPD